MINELHEKLLNNEVTSAKLVKESLARCHETNKRCNAFVTILDDAKGCEVTDNLLSGIPYGVKDNYSTKRAFCRRFLFWTRFAFRPILLYLCFAM